MSSRKKTQEEVEKIFKDRGYELLGTYVDSQTPVEYRCSCGNISTIRLSGVRRGDSCRKCKYNKTSASLRLDYNYVKDFFAKNGCELLEKEYRNARTPLTYKCSCGRISKIVFDSFRVGNRCRECGNKITADKQRLSQEEVEAYFKQQGCELLDTYSRSCAPMKYRCSCRDVSEISWANFSKGQRCKKCSIKSRSGVKHYCWIEDRKLKYEQDLFRDKCYKLLRIVLAVVDKKKTSKTEAMLGYSIGDLQLRITKHPNWNNVKNKSWHIDHVFPIKAFCDYKIKDISLINCLENLRPILYNENISKSGKYNKEDFEFWLNIKGVKWK